MHKKTGRLIAESAGSKLYGCGLGGQNGFGQHQYLIAEYFHHATIDGERLLTRCRGNGHRPASQRAHQRRVVIQHLELPFRTRKRHRRSLAREHFPIWSNDVELHVVIYERNAAPVTTYDLQFKKSREEVAPKQQIVIHKS